MYKKLNMLAVTATVVILSFSGIASAHVVVKPAQVGVGKFETFTTGVPNEKDMPTIALRLVIPESLDHVSPNVKQGWNTETKKSGEGEDAKITEINWTGGSIPSGFRDEFNFSAKVPAEATTIQWKAYQTYEDGTIVAWDMKPDKSKEDSKPYSETKIVKDLGTGSIDDSGVSVVPSATDDTESRANLALVTGLLGIVLGGAAFLSKRK